MKDPVAFETSLRNETSYISTLASSLGLVLDEFYKNINSVGCSAVTGIGCEEFLQAIERARLEYEVEYKPEYDRMLREENERLEKEKKELFQKMELGETVLGDMEAIPPKEPGSEILIRPSCGADSEDPDSEEEGPGGAAEQDDDERKEFESFRSFLTREKAKRDKKLQEIGTS